MIGSLELEWMIRDVERELNVRRAAEWARQREARALLRLEQTVAKAHQSGPWLSKLRQLRGRKIVQAGSA
jgi:hypothetical protein